MSLKYASIAALALAVPLTAPLTAGATLPDGDPSDLTVSKTVDTSYDLQWFYTIVKDSDPRDLVLSEGQSFTIQYAVAVSRRPVPRNATVSGVITITNPDATDSAVITSVTDQLSGGATGRVSCDELLPHTLGPGETLYCDYSVALGGNAFDQQNTVTVEVSADSDVGGASATEDVSFGDPDTVIDECATVTDSLVGDLGYICESKRFVYPYTVQYETCGDFEVLNTAYVVHEDTGRTQTADHEVLITVPCDDGCSLTPGYWKTHSEFGPAPYDETWAALPMGASTEFFDSGATYYDTLWTPPRGNAYYILARAYIAAELNFISGASSTTDVDHAFDDATGLFLAQGVGDVKLTKVERKNAIKWAGILDDYNNGRIGPGHCDEGDRSR